MRTPIEIALGVDSEGMTTARKLYTFLELDSSNYSRWCKSNITGNEFAEENVDYWAFVINDEWGGQATKDYRLTAHFAKKLSVKGNSEKAEEAREYFTRLEEKAKQKVIDYSQLSPELQMFQKIFNSVAEQQLEQKRQSKELSEVKQTVSTMKEIFTEPIGDWKNEINSRIREISIKSGIDYQTLYGEMYGELEMTAHCSLKRLQENKKVRMEKAGNTKTAIKEGTTKLQLFMKSHNLKQFLKES